MSKKIRFLTFLLFFAVMTISCGGGGGGGSTIPLPSPSITSFIASKSSILKGETVSITAVFSNGIGTIDNGIGTVTSGVTVSVSPSISTIYTLTVSVGGTSISKQLPVNVAVPWIELTPTSIQIVPYQSTTYTATVHGMFDTSVIWSTSIGGIIDMGQNQAILHAVNYACTGQVQVVSVADPTLKATGSFQVIRDKQISIAADRIEAFPGEKIQLWATPNYPSGILTWNIYNGYFGSPGNNLNYGNITSDGSYSVPWTSGKYVVTCIDQTQIDPVFGPVSSPPLEIVVKPFGPIQALSFPLTSAVHYPSISKLDSDNILIAGGFSNEKQAFIYNISTNSLSDPIQMVENRSGHTVTRLADGRLWMVGGSSIGTLPDGVIPELDSTEFYDPLTKTFTKGPDLPQRLINHAAILMKNGRVLVTGGNQGNVYWNLNCFIFDSVTNQITVGPHLGFRINHVMTEGPDGRIYLIGGQVGGRSLEDRVQIFDPDSETLSDGAYFWLSRGVARANWLPDGRLLITESLRFLYDEWYCYTTEIYDPVNDTIVRGRDAIFGRESIPTITSSTGRILLFPSGAHGAYEEYLPQSESFVVRASTGKTDRVIAVVEIGKDRFLVLFETYPGLSAELLSL